VALVFRIPSRAPPRAGPRVVGAPFVSANQGLGRAVSGGVGGAEGVVWGREGAAKRTRTCVLVLAFGLLYRPTCRRGPTIERKDPCRARTSATKPAGPLVQETISGGLRSRADFRTVRPFRFTLMT